MDWGTLATLVVGAVLAIVTGLVGQWWSEGRAVEREQRQRERDRDDWARDRRYDAHVQFLKTHDELYGTVQRAKLRRMEDPSGQPGEPPDDFLTPLMIRLTMVRLVSEKATADTAEAAFQALMQYSFRSGQWEMVDWTLDQYLGAVRQEFGLGPMQLMGEAPGEIQP